MKPKSMSEIPHMTLVELEEYLLAANHDSQGRKMALEEYNRKKLRQIAKPHWSIIPSFILLIISVVLSLIALWVTMSPKT